MATFDPLRTLVHGGKLASMRVLAAIVVVMSVVSCREADHQRGTPRAAKIDNVAALPTDDTSKLLSGELIEVPRSGRFLWNLQSIDAATLSDFLNEKARISRGKGRVVVQFEPGTPVERVAWVRSEIIKVGFCRWRGSAVESRSARHQLTRQWRLTTQLLPIDLEAHRG